MKINILTQPLYTNYGGILQNFALQEVLRKMGHMPLTINVPTKPPRGKIIWKDAIKSGINLYKKIKGEYPYPFLSPYKNAIKEYEFSSRLGEFVKKHINHVNVKAPFTSQTVKDYPADVWIVGSDQVWRPWCSHYIENCFFDFIPPETKTKRIAYAASFGTDQWEIDSEKTERIIPLAKHFDAISVREESGIPLVKNILGMEAVHALDPTLLLSSEDYLKLVPEDLLKNDSPKLTTYILDPNKEKRDTIKKYSNLLKLTEKKAGLIHKERIDSVEEWLADFATANVIITDSFHGTAFSIIFGKPFMVLKNPVRGNARIDSLLKSVSLASSDFGLARKKDETDNLLDNGILNSKNWLSRVLAE